MRTGYVLLERLVHSPAQLRELALVGRRGDLASQVCGETLPRNPDEAVVLPDDLDELPLPQKVVNRAAVDAKDVCRRAAPR